MAITSLAPDFPPVRVGLIGVGRHARLILLPALSLVPELELVALCTAHEETARQAQRRYRVPAYVGYEAMLRDAELDAVLVVGAPHAAAMLACLSSGRHVWCETPAVTSRDGAADVRAFAQETGRMVEVGSCLRYAPLYLRLKKELESWQSDAPGPRLFQCRYYPYIGHFYNLLLWLNGPIQELCAVESESETLVHLRFENGDLGSVTARRFSNDWIPYEQVAVSADNGLLVADNGQELRRYRSREKKPGMQLELSTGEVEAWTPTFSMPYGKLNHLYLRGYIPELEHFARRVRLGDPQVCGIDDMERTLLVREAVQRSAETRQWVTVEE
jgi:predicted dehydrogenase